MTSPYARPDQKALTDLERVVLALEEELAAVRGKARPPGATVGSAAPGGDGSTRQRIAILEGENQLLRQRIAAAKEQVERLRTRLRFVEEHGAGGGVGAGAGVGAGGSGAA